MIFLSFFFLLLKMKKSVTVYIIREYNKEFEWPEEIYLISHLKANYVSSYLLKLLHRVERNEYVSFGSKFSPMYVSPGTRAHCNIYLLNNNMSCIEFQPALVLVIILGTPYYSSFLLVQSVKKKPPY